MIKEFLINGVNKKFVPFWIDSAEDIVNDPYTTDCSGATTESNPHAYAELSIQNGALESTVCIKKSPGYIYGSYYMSHSKSKNLLILKFSPLGANTQVAVKPVAKGTK